MSTFSLNKHERLKGKKNIETLFRDGKAFFITPFKIIYTIAEAATTEAPVLFGVGVSKKNMKHATQRNYCKRIIKESFRVQKNPIYQYMLTQEKQLHVMFLYTAKEQITYDNAMLCVKKGLDALQKKLANKTA